MEQQQSSLGSHSHEKRLRFCLSAQFRSFDDNQRLSSGPPTASHHGVTNSNHQQPPVERPCTTSTTSTATTTSTADTTEQTFAFGFSVGSERGNSFGKSHATFAQEEEQAAGSSRQSSADTDTDAPLGEHDSPGAPKEKLPSSSAGHNINHPPCGPRYMAAIRRQLHWSSYWTAGSLDCWIVGLLATICLKNKSRRTPEQTTTIWAIKCPVILIMARPIVADPGQIGFSFRLKPKLELEIYISLWTMTAG